MSSETIEGTSKTVAETFDAETAVGGTSETPAQHFDAETVVVGGNWFTNLFHKAKKAAEVAGKAYVALQAQDGSQVNATPDALQKAAEMVAGAKAGDSSLQDKIKAVAALADQGDPAAKQANTVLQVANDYSKLQDAKAAAAVGGTLGERDINADLDSGDKYDWGW